MPRRALFLFLLAGSAIGCPSLTEPGEPVVFADPPPPPAPSTPVTTLTIASVAPAPPPTPPPTPSAQPPQESIEAAHILVSWKGAERSTQTRTKDEARKRISEVIAKLKKGADFGKLAAQYGEDGTKSSGGSLGSFTRGRMVPAFESAAFALKPGEVSGIVETQFGFHVIKRTK